MESAIYRKNSVTPHNESRYLAKVFNSPLFWYANKVGTHNIDRDSAIAELNKVGSIKKLPRKTQEFYHKCVITLEESEKKQIYPPYSLKEISPLIQDAIKK